MERSFFDGANFPVSLPIWVFTRNSNGGEPCFWQKIQIASCSSILVYSGVSKIEKMDKPIQSNQNRLCYIGSVFDNKKCQIENFKS